MSLLRCGIAAVSALLLLACAGNGVSDSTPPEEQVGEVAVVEEAVPEQQLLQAGSEAARELGLDHEWKGDYNAMVERRLIRALVVYSKTYYFMTISQC